jgi:hypothetical protein
VPLLHSSSLEPTAPSAHILINSLSQPRGADQAVYAHTVKAPAPSLSLGGPDLQSYMLSVGPDRASPGLARRRTWACVCVFVCVFVCAGRVWVHKDTRMHACTQIPTNTRTRACARAHTHIHTNKHTSQRPRTSDHRGGRMSANMDSDIDNHPNEVILQYAEA